MSLRSPVLSFLLGTAMAASPPQSQTGTANKSVPPQTLKTSVRLVIVDVVVTGNKGEAVSGLKKEDFQVFEDGKAQTVSVFEEHRGAPPTQIKLPPMPPNVYTNFPTVQAADSVNVILLDALNTPATDQAYVHSQMLKYAKTLPPNTRVAVFTLASRLRMLQGITTDSSELLAALNNLKANPSQSPLRPSTAEADAAQSRIDFLKAESMAPPAPANQIPAQFAADPVSATEQFLSDTAVFQIEMRTGMTLDALQQLARYLSDIPGRKNVIWFSGAFPAGVVPNSDLPDPFSGAVNFQGEIRRTTDLLTTAQVAIYPIAAEGLVSDTAFQVDNREIGQKRVSMAAQDRMQQSRAAAYDHDASHASMEQLARDTGGRAFYNTNGLTDALTRVVNNGSRFYSLAYSPSNPVMDGKYRHLQVKLASGKGTLSYRHGYYADDLHAVLTTGKNPDSDPLMHLMGRNLPDYSQILYKLLVKPVEPQPSPDAPRAGSAIDMKGPFTRYAVDFAVTPSDLRLEPDQEAAYIGSIEVALVAYDREGKPLNLVTNRSEIRIPAKDYASLLRGGLPIHREIDVPNGDAFLRTGIYDLKSGQAGTLGLPLHAGAAPAH